MIIPKFIIILNIYLILHLSKNSNNIFLVLISLNFFSFTRDIIIRLIIIFKNIFIKDKNKTKKVQQHKTILRLKIEIPKQLSENLTKKRLSIKDKNHNFNILLFFIISTHFNKLNKFALINTSIKLAINNTTVIKIILLQKISLINILY